MRKIEYTNAFKRDFKREKSGQLGKKLDELLSHALEFLVVDKVLPQSYRDHSLTGTWSDHRDCHLKTRFSFDLQKARYQYDSTG